MTGNTYRLDARRTLLAILMLSCCFVVPGGAEATNPETQAKFERDRKAILAMAGNYHVQFNFRETVALMPGYQLKEPYEPDGHEIIRVIRDDGNVISLQHILVAHGIWDDEEPIKHWRQDWIYEPEQIFEYAGHREWKKRTLSEAERRGKWAQLVYEVDDSPRYGAVGTHEYAVSAWTSPPTWRPLPRREATKRNDYDVLVSVNRHALTPRGWVHEQDNTKLSLGEKPRAIARENGINTYTSTNDFKIHIAEDYWRDTAAFWAEVRRQWMGLQQAGDSVTIAPRSQAGKLYNQILALANDVRTKKLDLTVAASRAGDLIQDATSVKAAGEGTTENRAP